VVTLYAQKLPNGKYAIGGIEAPNPDLGPIVRIEVKGNGVLPQAPTGSIWHKEYAQWLNELQKAGFQVVILPATPGGANDNQSS
jgi:hypothetical protein